jgi:hypothetical protein
MLSTYAHLAFVLFREYRLGFMSNQLYGDTQSTVKNIMFTVAKQHQRDPEGSVNANDDGDDPLEGLFSFTRMAGGHNSAMNYKQGVERSGWACDIAGVYGRWPALHRESRRRRVTRTEHKDHLNAASWNRDLKTVNCDLIDCWAMGEIEAIRIFREHSKLAPEKYNIRAILNSKQGIDFLRPWGDNIYPGFADDVDRVRLSNQRKPHLPLLIPLLRLPGIYRARQLPLISQEKNLNRRRMNQSRRRRRKSIPNLSPSKIFSRSRSPR